MLRSFALATLLLFTLLWTMTILPESRDISATLQAPVEIIPEHYPAASVSVTLSDVITVTTLEDERNNDGDCSLREALEAAEVDAPVDACPSGSGDDTVYLPAGLYQFFSGQLTLTGIITVQGSITGTSILDAGSVSRALYIDENARATLLHLDIRNGYGDVCCFFSEENYVGGAIVNFGTTLIAYSTIHDNKSGTYASDPYFDSWGPGGGIYNEGNLVVTASVIRNNSGGSGGGIYNRGRTTVSNSIIHDNRSGNSGGGGIHNEGDFSIAGSAISNNAADDSYCANLYHGGTFIVCYFGGAGGGINNAGTLSVNQSTISTNTAGHGYCTPTDEGTVRCGDAGTGGGIYNSGALTVVNSTISANAPGNVGCSQGHEVGTVCSVSGEGGGVFTSGPARLENSTITKNIRSKRETLDEVNGGVVGGIYNDGAVVVFKNTIIAGNEGSDCGGTMTSAGYNLLQNVISCTITGSFINWGAHLGPLQDYGGATLTHALTVGSPAIDTGDCVDSGGHAVRTDQRNEPRPQGARCDIGAYESPYTATFALITNTLPFIGR